MPTSYHIQWGSHIKIIAVAPQAQRAIKTHPSLPIPPNPHSPTPIQIPATAIPFPIFMLFPFCFRFI